MILNGKFEIKTQDLHTNQGIQKGVFSHSLTLRLRYLYMYVLGYQCYIFIISNFSLSLFAKITCLSKVRVEYP